MHIDIDLHWPPRDCDAGRQRPTTRDLQMALNTRHADVPRATHRLRMHNTSWIAAHATADALLL